MDAATWPWWGDAAFNELVIGGFLAVPGLV